MRTPEQIRLLLAAARLLGIEFTTDQAPGAWPNGSRVVKTKFAKGDAHQIGSYATVIGSVGLAPQNVQDEAGATCGYFVLWDVPPGNNIPSVVLDSRVALATADSVAPDRGRN